MMLLSLKLLSILFFTTFVPDIHNKMQMLNMEITKQPQFLHFTLLICRDTSRKPSDKHLTESRYTASLFFLESSCFLLSSSLSGFCLRTCYSQRIKADLIIYVENMKFLSLFPTTTIHYVLNHLIIPVLTEITLIKIKI